MPTPVRPPGRPPIHPKFIAKAAQDMAGKRLFADAKGDGNTDYLLREFGTQVAARCGCVPIFGPIKEKDGRATEKVRDDYGGDWYQLKDVVRMTIVVPGPSKIMEVRAEIRRCCGVGDEDDGYTYALGETSPTIRQHLRAEKFHAEAPPKFKQAAGTGLLLLKDQETTAANDPCGYSMWNFAVRMKNERPAEIQVNTKQLLYGKMTAYNFIRCIGFKEYLRLKSFFRIDGGRGHALYEIYRKDKKGAKGLEAAQISTEYYAYIRTTPPNSIVAKAWEVKFKDYATRVPAVLH